MMAGKEKKMLAVYIILNLAIYVGYGLIFYTIKSQNETSSSFLEEISALEDKADLIRSMKTIVENTSSDIDKLNSYFVSKDGVVGFIDSVEMLGKSEGVSVSVDSVDVGAATVSKPSNSGSAEENDSVLQVSTTATSSIEILKLSVSAVGNWQNIFWFLSSLEAMPVRLTVTDSDVSSVGSEFTPATSGAGIASQTKRVGVGDWKGTFLFEVYKLK